MTNQQTTFKNFGTDAIHAGQKPDPHSGALITPISMSSTFAQKSPGKLYPGAYEYSRTSNPTRKALEDCLAALEGAKYGLMFSSGLGATATMLHTLKAGDHVVACDDMYGGTQRYFRTIAAKFGIEFTFVDTTDLEAYEKAFVENKTKLVWIETPTNPTLKLTDIEGACKIAHKFNARVVVDNTFMSPYFQRPLALGADIVVHSCTKYIGGHSDSVMGTLLTSNDEIYNELKYLQNSVGMIPSPFDSFLILRSLKTLHVRMQRHEENAKTIAAFLEKHDKVEKVIYPGLESHPHHELAKKQMKGFGGMITFFVKGGLDEARTFLENVKVFALAESLGGVESLVEHPAIMTHASVPKDVREKLNISDTLIRLSVGIENIEDLLGDLENALSKM
mmetsp:Transcript_4533/g.6682  ORF Transcript_4533/g.6682 Transcript_4533/m.6682 type:complete len:392 (+) Transcript_4533:22-1197(+)